MTISRTLVPALCLLLSMMPLAVGCRSGADDEDEKAIEEPTADVRTAPILASAVTEIVRGLGTVTAAPGAAQTRSVPFECRVVRVPVTEGVTIDPGTVLVEVDPSPQTALELARARDETKAATDQAALIGQRLAMKLATREDLQNAEQRRRLAEITERSLESRGGGPRVLRAETAGTVARVDAQPGQILPAGAPLLETVPERGLMVRLGIEPSEASRVAAGQTVRLEPGQDRGLKGLTGRVTMVAGAVDPQTRLVEVLVGLDDPSRLRLNEYVRGRIETGRHDALVVPRDAIVPEEDHTLLFTVENGRAVRHVVRPGRDDGEVVEIEGPGVVAGAQVVVQGAAELQDGMSVSTDGDR